MSKKILFTASIAKHFLRFHLPYLKWFKEQGYEVHIACEGDEIVPFVDKKWTVPFVRSPFSIGHMTAHSSLKKIIDNESYTLIHCHTPMASIVTRFAARDARRLGTKVLYTAHGFHFYNGASLINWLTYFPVELFSSGWADAIITINSEDYNRIKKIGNQNTKYFLIPGIGVNKEKFFPIVKNERIEIRKTNKFEADDFIAVFAAEFIARKNHKFIIKALAKYKNDFPKLKVLFCGRGILKEQMEFLVRKNGLDSMCHFLGFREDVNQIFKMADIGISSSKQEGLGLNLIEEMMCGLPILATIDRGHKEIVLPGENGYLFEQNNEQEFIVQLRKLYDNPQLLERMSKKGIEKAQQFEIANSLKEMADIYNKFL